MKTRLVISSAVVAGLAVLGARCAATPADNSTVTNSEANASPVVANTNDGITLQHGVISSFPLNVLPLLDKVEVFDSIRNTADPALTVHEIEYVSNTGVTELYGKFLTQLTGAGWVEQNPQTQTVGTLQIMTGTFVKSGDTISVAIQTTAGDQKAAGATKVKLKIEQAE